MDVIESGHLNGKFLDVPIQISHGYGNSGLRVITTPQVGYLLVAGECPFQDPAVDCRRCVIGDRYVNCRPAAPVVDIDVIHHEIALRYICRCGGRRWFRFGSRCGRGRRLRGRGWDRNRRSRCRRRRTACASQDTHRSPP